MSMDAAPKAFEPLMFQQFGHRLTHGFTDVHIYFCVAALVVVAAAALCDVVGVSRGDTAFELGMSRRITDCESLL